MPPTVPPAGGAGPAAHRAHDERNSHLRDVKHVAGYHIQAADGSIGHVEDFLLDTQSWTIRYLIVDTSKWIGGRHVLVAPTWVGAIRWETSQIEVAMTRDAVRRSPEYDARGEVQRSYEDRLHVHYDQPPYWVDDRNGAAHEDVSHRSRVGRLEQFKDLEIADGDTDVRGWKIVASDGVTVGHVKHLIVDRAAMKVRYLEAGLEPPHAGARTRDVLIPLEDIEIEKPAREVRLRSVPSPRLAALPTFSGFPIDPETLAATRTHFAGGAPSADPDQALQPERRRTTSGRA
jgi:sporulation protein YlmC with PRC-barrel domain